MRIILLFFIFITFKLFAQEEFKLQATLEKVTESGFYKLKLPVQVISAMENFPNDMRIYDAQGNETPYLLKAYDEHFSIESTRFHYINSFRIKSFNGQTFVRIQNKKHKVFSRFYVMYKNAQTGQNLRLYAGNLSDQLEQLPVHLLTQTINSGFTVLQLIDFPPCSFNHYEIRIEASDAKYAQIQQVGYLDRKIPGKNYVRLSKPEIKQQELSEQKLSLIEINFKTPQRVDAVYVYANGTEFYHRNANFLIKDSTVYKKKKSYFFRNLKSFKISSNIEPYIEFDNFRTQKFYLQIENKDNPPISIDSIVFFQKKYYLVARFEKNKQYILRCGNKNLHKPEYDLQYFSDKIPGRLKNVKILELTKLKQNKTVDSKGFKPGKNIVWIVILFVSAILIFIVVKMMKNTDN